MKYIASCLLMALLSATAQANSDDFIQWQNTSLTALYGTNYDVVSEDQTTFTFEHAHGNSWGDVFLFVDQTNYRNSEQGNGTYGEFTSRFSASKLLDTDASYGIVKDIYLAASFESGKGDTETLLYGPSIDLAIPHFNFFQVSVLKRDPNNNNSEGWQLTPVWSASFPFMSSEIVVDGFIDWVFKSDKNNYKENFHFNPQIKYDLGMSLWGESKKGKLLVGIEYDYWSNKYGIDDSAPFDVDQSTFSWIVKYHF